MTRLALALFLLAAAPTPAYAEQCRLSAPLRTGDAAPCDGVLAPGSWAARALMCLRVELPTCETRGKAAATLATADMDACRAGRRAVEQLAEERLRLLRESVPVVAPSPVWHSPWLWGPVGVLVGIVSGWAATR